MPNKENTVNDYQERLNRVLAYIQENTEKPLALDSLAAVANFSPFRFHRIFSAHVGATVFDYVRRVRLDKAAFKLSYCDEPITDIALSAGYETPAAFTKAFKQRFSQNPTEFKRLKRRSRGNEPQCISDTPFKKIAGRMKAELCTQPKQQVLFIRKTGRYDKAAAEAWGALMQFAYSRRLISKDTKIIGIPLDSPEITPEQEIRYDACITFTGNMKPEGEVGLQTIAGGAYAAFLHKGPYNTLDNTYNYIMAAWLPESSKKLRDAPSFELYQNRDPRRTKPENLKTVIYMPIE